jgi:hypothetical protein
MIPTNVIPIQDVQYSKLCGVCPLCDKTDGFVNLGKEHWFICRDHETKWFVGINLFEGWQNQTVAEAQSIERMLDGYKEITPLKHRVDEQPQISVAN